MVDERKEKRKQRLRVEKDLIRRNQAVRKTPPPTTTTTTTIIRMG
jgi:hypothetical protein